MKEYPREWREGWPKEHGMVRWPEKLSPIENADIGYVSDGTGFWVGKRPLQILLGAHKRTQIKIIICWTVLLATIWAVAKLLEIL